MRFASANFRRDRLRFSNWCKCGESCIVAGRVGSVEEKLDSFIALRVFLEVGKKLLNFL